MAGATYLLIDPRGDTLAEFLVTHEEDGWYTGVLTSERLTPEVKSALGWYDEVVQHQMLSFLDEANAAVEGFGLGVQSPSGTTHRVYSLDITPHNEVSFRITPVPPPSG